MTSTVTPGQGTAIPAVQRPTLAGRFKQFLSLLRSGLTATRPDRSRLLGTVLLALLAGTLETILLLLLAAIAIALTRQNALGVVRVTGFAIHITAANLVLLAGALTGALLLISYPLAELQASLSSRLIVRTRERILDAYLHTTMSYRETHNEGYFQQLIGEYCTRAENAVQQFATGLVTLATLAVIIAGALVATPKTALALFAGLLASALVAAPLARHIRRVSSRHAATSREIAIQSAQTARLSEEIAVYHVIDNIEAGLNESIRHAAAQLHQVRLHSRLAPSLHQYVTMAIVIAIIGAEIYLAPRVHPGVVGLALLLVRAMAYARQLLSAAQSGSEAMPYLEAVNNQLRSLDANRAPEDGLPLAQFAGITLSNVSFAYVQPVLRDISLSIRPGEIVGIIGPSGGGKSTLCALLLKLKEPQAGVISTGDTALKDVCAASWSRLTAFATQDSKLILSTVADNIRFFRPQYSDAQVEHVARAANIHDEIAALPEGYQTLIGPGERGLSGGQRQRIAIARALLGGPKLLVLDEPTSALDRESEVLIGQTLENLRGSVAVVLISHRPATLRACDRVLNLIEGRLSDAAAALAEA